MYGYTWIMLQKNNANTLHGVIMLHTVLRKATTNSGPFSRTYNKASRPSSSKIIWKMNGFTMRNSQWWHFQYLMHIVTDGLMTQENPAHVEHATINEMQQSNITLNNAISCTVPCVTKHRLCTFAHRTFYASPFTRVIQFCCEQPMWQLTLYTCHY